jgi:hypothetical protein
MADNRWTKEVQDWMQLGRRKRGRWIKVIEDAMVERGVEGQRIDTEWYGKGSKDCISEFCDSG